MHIVLVSGGETRVRESMNGIGRLHWVKSRRSCLMKSKPYIYKFHSLGYGARVYLHLSSLLLAVKMTQAHQTAPLLTKLRNGKCERWGGQGLALTCGQKND